MIQIEPQHLSIVKSILKTLQNEIFVFGSRAKGTAKKLSDLDLVIMGDVEGKLLSEIKAQLEESNLPYKVDIVIWDKISDSFQDAIKKDLVKFEI